MMFYDYNIFLYKIKHNPGVEYRTNAKIDEYNI